MKLIFVRPYLGPGCKVRATGYGPGGPPGTGFGLGLGPGYTPDDNIEITG